MIEWSSPFIVDDIKPTIFGLACSATIRCSKGFFTQQVGLFPDTNAPKRERVFHPVFFFDRYGQVCNACFFSDSITNNKSSFISYHRSLAMSSRFSPFELVIFGFIWQSLIPKLNSRPHRQEQCEQRASRLAPWIFGFALIIQGVTPKSGQRPHGFMETEVIFRI